MRPSSPTTERVDAVVVGAGHNGLICAAYLARAGLDTLIVEARDEVGGCASTVDALGARFNICNCDHTMIRAMPIVDELELGDHGLHYIDAVPSGINVFHDGSEPWAFVHDTQAMLDTLSQSHPRQVDGYRRYLSDALPVANLVLQMARTVPGTRRLARQATAGGSLGAAPRLLEWSRRSVNEIFGRYFDDWHMAMPAISTGPTVWGVSPDTPGTGLAALAYATRHLVQTGRPEGGSGMLTTSTARSFTAAGGRVLTGTPVERVLIRDGEACGVALRDGRTIAASSVIAACDPQRVWLDWIDELPAAARKRRDEWRARPVAQGYESKIDAVISELPRYRWADTLADRFPGIDMHGPTTIVSPDPDALAEAHRLRGIGRVAEQPTVLMNIPSALDPTMKTDDGQHILSLEVLFTPYEVEGGWPTSPEPERWLQMWADSAAPGALESVSEWRVMTPDRYEEEFMMHRGHTPSYAGSPLAALFGRNRELTRYRTPIEGLYLSGAATFPGAGIFGASGRNTAAAVVADTHDAVGRRVAEVRRRGRALRNGRVARAAQPRASGSQTTRVGP